MRVVIDQGSGRFSIGANDNGAVLQKLKPLHNIRSKITLEWDSLEVKYRDD